MSLRTVGSAQLDANLPVTALVTFQLKEQRLVLHGCGTFVRLVDEQTGSVVHKLQALTRHNVHGLLPLGVRQVPACQRDQELFLAWGGPAVRLLCVGYDDSGDGRTMRLSVQSSEHLASDWILDAEISQARGPLSPEAVLVTAHNVLLGVVITRTPAGSVWRLRTTELASGLKSILYSADVVWLSPTQILVAAGTVFGEIVVWSHFLPASAAGQAESVTHHFFTGHEGSIFGVDIAPAFTTPTTHQSCRLLASCSDDRTIRLWDISDCSSGTSINTHGKTANDHETGFGNSYSHESSVMQGCVSATFGHASRIWGVEFLDTLSRDDALQVQLISRGEDATTQLWHATVRLNDCQRPCGGDIRHARKHEFHSGRNVWSLATHEEEDGFSVYSGGADGSIVMYPVPRIAQQDATIPSAMDATVAQPSSHKLSRYGFVSDQHILATTPAGHVLLGTVHHSAEETQTSVKCALVWDTIAQRDDLRGHSCMASDSKRGIAVLCGLAGEVILYRHDRRSFTRITEAPERVAAVYLLSASADCSIRFVTGHMSTNIAYFFNVSLDDEVNGSKVDRLVLQPPTTFCVTSAQYLSDLECVALGGRTGGLLLFNVGLKTTGGTTVPSLTLDHIHGRDTMTAILPLPKDGAHHDSVHTQCVLTTGRDGYYGIHRIGKSIQAYTLETIHRSSPPLGSHIEGAFLDAATRDLILYGFQSTRFTVFNETTRSVISAVECGGAHRAWAYLHSTDGARRSTFAWTKSSTLHISTQVGPDQRLVSVGGHGREIKALAVAGSTARLYGEPCRVLATGAEDTTIRLLVYRPSAVNDKHGSLQTIVVLNKHTTGLQHLQFSPCGKYLFSSGGLEEFFVWKINEVPALGLGAVLEGECPKSQLKSDLRITNFDISPILAHDNEVKEFLVALTYSNSEVKVFLYHAATRFRTSSSTLLAQGRYSTNCLTQVQLLVRGTSIDLLTASTDGHLVLWPVSEAIASFIRASHGVLTSLGSSSEIVSRGVACLTWRHRSMVHQSSIKALDVVRVPCTDDLGENADVPVFVTVTGGDDNSLAVTAICTPSSSASGVLRSAYASSTKSDHAAAINAVSILGCRRLCDDSGESYALRFASSGNDQQLRIHESVLRMGVVGGKSISLDAQLIEDLFTPVADISALGHFQDENHGGTLRLLVCGVGMELWGVRGSEGWLE